MNNSVSRKYILVLAALAMLILVVGALFRPKKITAAQPSPSETASLQARVRWEELGETAAFFAHRAQAFGRSVVYNQEQASSAVAWEKPGQVLTTGAQITSATSWPVSVKTIDAGTPPIARPTEQAAGRWVLIVGRTVEGQLLWSPAVYGGTKRSTCEGEGFTELISNARIDRGFSGAGVFDLDCQLVGIVAPCGADLPVISVASVQPLLKAFHTPERRIRAAYGFEVEELDADGRRFFSVDAGLLVTELERGGLAERAGLKAGDVIIGAGGAEGSTKVSFLEAVLAGGEDSRNFTRQGRNLTSSFLDCGGDCGQDGCYCARDSNSNCGASRRFD